MYYKRNIEKRSRKCRCGVRQEVLHILCVSCSLSYAACKAHAQYYFFICGLFGCFISPPGYFIKGMIFGQNY